MRAAGNFWRGTLQNGTTQMINKCYKPKRKQWICAWCIAIRGHMYVPCHATLSQSMDVYGWMGRMDGCCVEIYFSDIFITDERTIKWTKKKCIPYVNDSSFITRMDQFHRLIPFVWFRFVVSLLSIHVWNGCAGRYPEKGSEEHHGHCDFFFVCVWFLVREEKDIYSILFTLIHISHWYEYSLTMLSRKKRNTLLILISSMMSQKRSTTSCILFSQTPCDGKYQIKVSCKTGG